MIIIYLNINVQVSNQDSKIIILIFDFMILVIPKRKQQND